MHLSRHHVTKKWPLPSLIYQTPWKCSNSLPTNCVATTHTVMMFGSLFLQGVNSIIICGRCSYMTKPIKHIRKTIAMHVAICLIVQLYNQLNVCVCVCVCACVCACVRVCVCASACVCVCACVHNSSLQAIVTQLYNHIIMLQHNYMISYTANVYVQLYCMHFAYLANTAIVDEKFPQQLNVVANRSVAAAIFSFI